MSGNEQRLTFGDEDGKWHSFVPARCQQWKGSPRQDIAESVYRTPGGRFIRWIIPLSRSHLEPTGHFLDPDEAARWLLEQGYEPPADVLDVASLDVDAGSPAGEITEQEALRRERAALVKELIHHRRAAADALEEGPRRAMRARALGARGGGGRAKASAPLGARGAGGMSQAEAAAKAKAIVKAEGWQGIKPLARRVGTTPATMRKAVKRSAYLTARRAEHDKAKAAKRRPREAGTGGRQPEPATQGDVLAGLIAEQEADAKRDARRAR